MKMYDEDHLRILTYLQVNGFKPLSVIVADGKKYYEDEEQFRIVFNDMKNHSYIQENFGETIPGRLGSEKHPYGITQTGKLRLQALQKEKKAELKQQMYNRWVLGIAIVAAVAALYLIYLAYCPPKA